MSKTLILVLFLMGCGDDVGAKGDPEPAPELTRAEWTCLNKGSDDVDVVTEHCMGIDERVVCHGPDVWWEDECARCATRVDGVFCG